MKDDLNFLKMEDDLNFRIMEDNLYCFCIRKTNVFKVYIF